MRQLENGLSERTLAFEPGSEVHGEVVCRTFSRRMWLRATAC